LPDREESYYTNRNMKPSHDYLLNLAEELRCPRIGLILDGDSFEYPLTWRAMQAGRKVRHIQPGDDSAWPCILYSDLGALGALAPEASRLWYNPGGDGKTFTRMGSALNPSAARITLKLSPENRYRGVRAGNDVTLDVNQASLKIRAYGTDPYLFLPIAEGRCENSTIAKIDISSETDTLLKVYYSRRPDGEYAETDSIQRRLPKGRHDIYFRFNSPEDLNGPLRIDIGTEPGHYDIHSVKIFCE